MHQQGEFSQISLDPTNNRVTATKTIITECNSENDNLQQVKEMTTLLALFGKK